MKFHLSVTLPSAPIPPPPTSGELWYLKSYPEAGKSVVGNFCAISIAGDPLGKTMGQANWVQMDYPAEIELLQRIDNAPYGSPHWHYLVRETNGSLYATVGEVNEDTVGASIKWFRICIGSKEDGMRNQVLIIDGDPLKDAFVRIAGIPHSASYSQYSPSTHPHLFHRVYCDYGQVIGDTPQGILYMPLLEPSSGYKVSAGDDQMWLPTYWLHSKVSDTPPLGPAIVHELITLTSPRPIVAHLYRIDLSQVNPFVTPVLGYKLTPSQFMEKYSMDFAVNGDGGPWLFGALVPAGRWMSNGDWLSTLIGENSIWFDRAGNCQFKYSKPSNFEPWNVISGPSHMIQNGAIFQAYDNTLLAGRSAFGLFDATHAFALAIEGIEKVSGMTEQELAEFGLSLKAVQMMEFDSGGSTGVSQRNGVSYSVENRPVLNALCFKIKS